MVVYKGYKAWYLGLKRWKVEAPDGFRFDVRGSGIWEMTSNIDRWRKHGWV